MLKTEKKIKLYFIGSGEIGIPVLKRLTESNSIDIVGIGTQDDKIAGRKKKLTPTPIAAWAVNNNFEVDKIKSVNSDSFLSCLNGLTPDIILIISFGQILKERILNIASKDCVNIHTSLLPGYRGASPISSAILNGDMKTGVTFMRVQKALDSGPIFQMNEYVMTMKETSLELESILGNLAAENVVDVLEKICHESMKPVEQDHENATYVKKVKKEDGLLSWNDSAEKIERMVRGYYPWPGAYFFINTGKKHKRVQITSAGIRKNIIGEPGFILKADKKEWIVACGDYSLEIKKLIPEGKNEMTGTEFLMGHRLKEGMNLLNE